MTDKPPPKAEGDEHHRKFRAALKHMEPARRRL